MKKLWRLFVKVIWGLTVLTVFWALIGGAVFLWRHPFVNNQMLTRHYMLEAMLFERITYEQYEEDARRVYGR